jgi:hypothetical protein
MEVMVMRAADVITSEPVGAEADDRAIRDKLLAELKGKNGRKYRPPTSP